MFDSGSPTTWIKCKPCITCNQNEPIFDPFQSSTFSSCISGNCTVNQSYHDKSYSTGITVHDTLTLSNGVSFPNFEFLCSHNNSGFQGFAGLLGLELSENSFINQTTETFSQIFGYCLPSLESSTGFLAFGDEAVAACSPQFRVPLVAGPNGYDKYYVDLVAITIGEKRLQMPSNDDSSSSSKVILDSGTPISHLPQSVYSELSSSFQELMSEYGPFYSSGSMTCFNLEGHDLSTINIPTITLQFGDSLDLMLPSTSVVLIENSNACLAFIGDDETIIGTHQQRDLNILYDISNKQVGFSLSKGSCSY
ncbi:aspartyl protease AED1-like [Pistacia vera]|uniref:aspartyl protease AED1-like n=1 Tax=Pistacia vera TaxID=55513 RepID=UPI001263E0C9|nr:aspartyl protease AED1-like [Pistacia vera]